MFYLTDSRTLLEAGFTGNTQFNDISYVIEITNIDVTLILLTSLALLTLLTSLALLTLLTSLPLLTLPTLLTLQTSMLLKYL